MPIIKSTYKPPFYLQNGHVSTILPSIFRKVEGVNYERERITTPDDDFLDIDWIKNDNAKLVIVFHGLEGNSQRHYVKGVAKHFSKNGWDVAAWNARSCSGEMNRQPRLYHHADIEDISTTIRHILTCNNYKHIALVGFSMGGEIVLNYLIDNARELPKTIHVAVAISAPIHVGGSVEELEKISRAFYRKRFLGKLKKKIKVKGSLFPDKVKLEGLDKISSFLEFDNRYTAPLHGFADSNDFYQKASSEGLLSNIPIPTLLLIAKNDPFMPASCYPYKEARENAHIYLEVPLYGGHVGFPLKNFQHSWMEIRALNFIEKYIQNSKS